MLINLERYYRILILLMSTLVMWLLQGAYLTFLLPALIIFLQLEIRLLACNKVRRRMLRKRPFHEVHRVPILITAFIVMILISHIEDGINLGVIAYIVAIPTFLNMNTNYDPNVG